MTAPDDAAVVDRISDYLASGGLFNPEVAIHDRVRGLLIDCRATVERLTRENADLRGVIRADEERLRAAEFKVFGENVHGCDAADWIADAYLAEQQSSAALLASLRARVEGMRPFTVTGGEYRVIHYIDRAAVLALLDEAAP